MLHIQGDFNFSVMKSFLFSFCMICICLIQSVLANHNATVVHDIIPFPGSQLQKSGQNQVEGSVNE